MPTFDFTNPPSRDSSPGAVKRFWSEWQDHATPAQKVDFAARGISAPEMAKPQHTMIPEYSGQNYRQFAAAEAAKDKKSYDFFMDYHNAATAALRQEALMGFVRTRNHWVGGRVDEPVIAACLKELQDPAELVKARAWVNYRQGKK
jgi:hypothetical protein